LQLQVSVKQLVQWNHAILTTKKGMYISTEVFFFEQPTELFHIVLFFVENA